MCLRSSRSPATSRIASLNFDAPLSSIHSSRPSSPDFVSLIDGGELCGGVTSGRGSTSQESRVVGVRARPPRPAAASLRRAPVVVFRRRRLGRRRADGPLEDRRRLAWRRRLGLRVGLGRPAIDDVRDDGLLRRRELALSAQLTNPRASRARACAGRRPSARGRPSPRATLASAPAPAAPVAASSSRRRHRCRWLRCRLRFRWLRLLGRLRRRPRGRLRWLRVSVAPVWVALRPGGGGGGGAGDASGARGGSGGSRAGRAGAGASAAGAGGTMIDASDARSSASTPASASSTRRASCSFRAGRWRSSSPTTSTTHSDPFTPRGAHGRGQPLRLRRGPARRAARTSHPGGHGLFGPRRRRRRLRGAPWLDTPAYWSCTALTTADWGLADVPVSMLDRGCT